MCQVVTVTSELYRHQSQGIERLSNITMLANNRVEFESRTVPFQNFRQSLSRSPGDFGVGNLQFLFLLFGFNTCLSFEDPEGVLTVLHWRQLTTGQCESVSPEQRPRPLSTQSVPCKPISPEGKQRCN